MKRRYLLLGTLLLAGCAGKPSAEDARKFLDDAESRLLAASNEAGRAQWVAANFITSDTEALSAAATERAIKLGVGFAKDAVK
jgi:peptidyl-dipeptidase A